MAYASNAVRGTAFHEAGNAVVARYFGQKVIKLEIREDGSGTTETVGATDDLPLIDRIAILCAGEASRTIFKCRSRALAVSSEISKLVEVLVDDHQLEIRNAGYRRAIEIIKSNAPEVEQLAGRLIRQRRVREAQLNELERQTTATQANQVDEVPAANVVRFSVPPISWRGSINAGQYVRLRHFAKAASAGAL
jgi:Peptidase M50B-like